MTDIVDAYTAFLARKRISDPSTGLVELPALPSFLFPHQHDIVSWALRRGRAAIFAGTGLGKTGMELTWGEAVAAYTPQARHLLRAARSGATAYSRGR